MDNQQTNPPMQANDPGSSLPPLQQQVPQAVPPQQQSQQLPMVQPPQAPQQQQPQSQVPMQLPQPVVDPSLTNSPATVPVNRALVPTPEEAGDNDLIEKEWVTKAKEIVGHTVEDPFTQQNEISKMKADYMKKRYNKDLRQAP